MSIAGGSCITTGKVPLSVNAIDIIATAVYPWSYAALDSGELLRITSNRWSVIHHSTNYSADQK